MSNEQWAETGNWKLVSTANRGFPVPRFYAKTRFAVAVREFILKRASCHTLRHSFRVGTGRDQIIEV